MIEAFRRASVDARLLLVAIPVALWTIFPIYHMVLLAVSPKSEALSGKLWPDNPTLENFQIVLTQRHYYLEFFWVQLGNSVLVAFSSAAAVLFVATCAAFAISRLRVPGARVLMNLSLLTYFVPAAFLAVPMYRTMGFYDLLDRRLGLIIAMITLASPYAIWVLKQASDKLPVELDEAAAIDGATPFQIFRLVYLPLMIPALIAVGTYALLMAWNEYLYAYLIVSKDHAVTLPVGLGNFLLSDDSPWELFMATGLIYAIPPAVIYYVFRKYMVGGMTEGAVKN